jgi:mRNA-degrading endonuclease RelE of RelBE toxin-antitoxin system
LTEEEQAAIAEARDEIARGESDISTAELMRQLGIEAGPVLTREALHAIVAEMLEYAASEQGEVKRLQGVDPPEGRLRVGGIRAIFQQDPEIIRVLRVLPRGRAYHR